MDPRITKLAHTLVNHSLRINKGDIIQVDFGVEALPLALEVQRLILEKHAWPKMHPTLPGLQYNFYKHASDAILSFVPAYKQVETDETNGYISIICYNNTKELTNIPAEAIAKRQKAFHHLHEQSINQDNWVLTKYPTAALAQDAEMSLQEFTDFYFNAVDVDFAQMEQQQESLKQIFDHGKVIRVLTHDTDLTLSIEGRQGVKCHGRRNIPDGEVYIAPVETKVDGKVTFSFPAIYGGREVDGISLVFKDGVVVEAKAKKNEDFLKKMLATDEGASRLGEFAIATNYNITTFTRQILFDEKIGGTIHMALGAAYKKGGGTNQSAIHWDMIKDLRKGGKIFVDDKLIFENGALVTTTPRLDVHINKSHNI